MLGSLVKEHFFQILRWYQNLSKIRWATCYQVTTIRPLGSCSRCPVLSKKRCAQSLCLPLGAVLALQAGFVRIESGPTQILRWYQSLSMIHWATCKQVTAIGPRYRCLVLGVTGVG